MPKPKLKPFWYTPEFQEGEPVKFRLKPLTEADMVDVEEHYEASGTALVPTRKAQYEAGRIAIQGVEGGDLKWPADRDHIDRGLVIMCGWRAITEANGGDWDRVIALMEAVMEGRELEEPEPHEDPSKNS